MFIYKEINIVQTSKTLPNNIIYYVFFSGNHKKITRATLIEALADVEVDSDHDMKIPVKSVTSNVLVLPTPLTNVMYALILLFTLFIFSVIKLF